MSKLDLIGPVELPSGRNVYFREPQNTDRRQLLDGFGSEELNKPGKLEEALAYTCMLKLDSSDVDNLPWSKRADLLNIRDGQFYQALFMEMFTINKDDFQQVQLLAKKLRGGSAAS